ncbi:Bro-N domain-containing protein [Salmonella enterica]|nr:Bro-N domain-containing protein [Salmonella enterica]
MCKPVFHAGRSEISVIKFDGIKVRVVNINGEPWFVGADVCAALEISNVTDAVSALDNDEVSVVKHVHFRPVFVRRYVHEQRSLKHPESESERCATGCKGSRGVYF